MIPISELKEGDSITSMYAVRRKETPREYRNKEGKYFFFTVGDKTGDIVVKFWGGADLNRTMETYGALKVGDVVEISGDVEFDRFDDRLVVRMSEGIHGIRFCSGSEYAVSDFLPASDKDLDALYSQLLERMSEIGDEHLRHLVSLFLNDEDFGPAYRSAPASMMHHHNYIGGLLEHTLNVVGLCDRVADNYPELNRDLLVTAAMLYDVGKVSGYVFTTSIDISDEGQFVGNLALSYSMVKEKVESMDDFPQEMALKLFHIILSHHGDREKYSTKRFRLPEVCVLHYADSLDAQVNEFLVALGEEDGENWPYSKRLGHAVYKGE